MIQPPPAPPPAVALPWLEQPSAAELALAKGLTFRNDRAAVRETMTCSVRGDGRLEACEGEPGAIYPQALISVSGRYRIDRARFTGARVTVSAELPKLYDTPAQVVKAPSRDALQAYARSGVVELSCLISAEGRLRTCELDPTATQDASAETIAAAQRATADYTFKPARLAGRAVEGFAHVTVAFSKVTPADWLRRPIPDEFEAVWPVAAAAASVDGTGYIGCRVVAATGRVTDCRIVDESPPGYGFGAAALQLAPAILMKPELHDGRPIDNSHVVIPVAFKGGAGGLSLGDTQTIMAWAPYTAAPSAGAMLAVYPPRALTAKTSGKVSLRCAIGKAGELKDCVNLLESPRGEGFDAAAKRLLPAFKVDVANLPSGPMARLRTDLMFDFDAANLGEDRVIRRIDWSRSISREKLGGGLSAPRRSARA